MNLTMSKMDGLRAMREARYEQAASRAPRPAAAPKATTKPAPRAAETRRPAVAAEQPDVPQAEAALRGHRAISGRTCTREQGHAAKSHRYS